MYYFGYLHYKIVVICTNNTICIITKFKAHRWHSRGRGFDPLRLHHKKAITMQVLRTAWFFSLRIYVRSKSIFFLISFICNDNINNFIDNIMNCNL